MKSKENIIFIDSTLRDGEQSPGVVFSREEKQEIAFCLDVAGIHEIEVGTPAIGNKEVADIKSIVNMNLKSRLTGWARCNNKDFKACLNADLSSIHVSFPASALLMKVFNLSKEKIMQQLKCVSEELPKYFDFVSVGFQDIARTDKVFLSELIDTAFSNKISRVRLADTLGLMNPVQVWDIFSYLKGVSADKCLEFHGHNDLGMACANSVIAVLSGAEAVSVTVNGLGERAGNAALEEVVLALHVSAGVSSGIDTSCFYQLSKVVSKASSMKNSPLKPVVGERVFLHESGIHARGIVKIPESYEPFKAESVGNPNSGIVFGKHSGRFGLYHSLKKQGIELSRYKTRQLLNKIKTKAYKTKSSVEMNDILKMCADQNDDFSLAGLRRRGEL